MELKLARLELRYEQETKRLPDTRKSIAKALHDWGLSTGPQEVGWVISVDAHSRVHTVVEVARGSMRSLPIHMPTLLAAVIASAADRFIFVHSHPAGNTDPSDLDMVLTKQISDAAAICGLYFEDHMIVSQDKLTSLRQKGLYIPPEYIQTEAARYGS